MSLPPQRKVTTLAPAKKPNSNSATSTQPTNQTVTATPSQQNASPPIDPQVPPPSMSQPIIQSNTPPARHPITLSSDLGPDDQIDNLRGDEDPVSLKTQIFQENAAWYIQMIEQNTSGGGMCWPGFLEDFRKHFPQRGIAKTFTQAKGTIVLAFRSRQNLRTTKVKLEYVWEQNRWVLKDVAMRIGLKPPQTTRQQLNIYRATYGEWIKDWLVGQNNKMLGNGQCTMLVSEAIAAFSKNPEKKVENPLDTVWFNHGYCIYMQRGSGFDSKAFEIASIGPGDVIQYYIGPNIDTNAHTAVIKEVLSVGVVIVLHQNAGNGPKVVHEEEKNLWKEERWIEIYRIMPSSWVEDYTKLRTDDWQ
ncbi:MAG: hypothetical protein M1813_001636 [Trichoglossum hirsutum]|nr:MAG: hypothetical protein M1813_001636 [Trichoglossum hirsutum]